jgi:hypothetical protein
MTTIGKILAFLNLIIGLGFVSYAVTLYSQRPGWFDPVPEVVDKGQSPRNFAQLKQEHDNLGRAASVASGIWGKEHKRLLAAEKRRADRQAEWKRRAQWIRTGHPSPPDAKDAEPGFFERVYEQDASGKDTAYLDHTKLGASVKQGGVALRGADKLKDLYENDVLAVAELEKQIEARLKEYDALGVAIETEERRLLKMMDIRAAVQAELFYLSSFEVNVYETRETVFRRKAQLVRRLTELGGIPKK